MHASLSTVVGIVLAACAGVQALSFSPGFVSSSPAESYQSDGYACPSNVVVATVTPTVTVIRFSTVSNDSPTSVVERKRRDYHPHALAAREDPVPSTTTVTSTVTSTSTSTVTESTTLSRTTTARATSSTTLTSTVTGNAARRTTTTTSTVTRTVTRTQSVATATITVPATP